MSGNVHFRKLPSLLFFKILFVLLLGMPQSFAKSSSAIQDTPMSVSTVSSEEIENLPARTSSVDSIQVITSRLPNLKQNLRETSSNVSYKSEEDLEETRSLTFQDAVKDLEGVTLFDSVGNGWDTELGLRGFRGSSNITFLVDGVRVNEVDGNGVVFPLLTMNNVESIQVDRGSASPIYGSNTFAGVVNITTGQPSTKRLKLFGGFEWTSFQGLNFNQGFSGTIKDELTPLGGKFKYYFNGGRNVGEGWRGNSEWRITNFDIKTAYELADEQGQAYVNVKHVADAISNPGEMTFQQYQDDETIINKPLDGRDYRNTIVQIGADKKFFDNHLTASIMNSWRTNLTHFFVTSGTFIDAPFDPDTDMVTTNGYDQNLIGQLQYENYLHEDIFSQTRFGIEFRDQNNYGLEQDAPNGNVAEGSSRETERGADAYNTALFWRETLKFYEKVTGYFGMRHDFHWLGTDDFLRPQDSIDRRWQKSTLSTGLNYTPWEYADFFANYAQGFRVPAISDITPFGGTVSTNLEPEEADSYEAGTRLRYKDLAAYKVSYFLIDLNNEIGFDSTAVGPTAPFGQNINIAKSRRYGIEQRIDLSPIQELKFYGSYTWLRAYVRETGRGGTPFDERELGQIPENRFTFGAAAAPLARFGENYEGFKVSLRGVFTGRQHPQSYESSSQAILNATGGAGHVIKNYTVWDFMLSYEWREKMIYFKINNVFGEKYYSRAVSATSFGTAIYPAGTFSFVNPGAPREFVLGSKWEF